MQMTGVRRDGRRMNRKDHTRTDTGEIETINYIGVHGALLLLGF